MSRFKVAKFSLGAGCLSSIASSFCHFLLLVFIVFSMSCAQESSSPTSGRVSPIYSAGPPELSYCSSAVAHGGATVTISGKAIYQARQLTGSGLGAPGAGAPVRYAEVRVTDSAGNVSQCAETNANGDFSFSLPQNSATYTISVNARANNSFGKVSVLNKPELNQVYALTTSVTADSTKSVGTMTAAGTGNILAGAFNIYDQIIQTNDYLRTHVGTCPFSGCQAFTVAPKVQAYWEKGFNPMDYFGSNLGGVSYYLPGYSRLFILGGINGDTDTTDTDHFDNSVIIHEYGHFIEDVLTKSDSPGGSHNGNGVIDPRLAWGEGWGNFIQAAVQNDPRYIDTVGNVDGTPDFALYIDLESPDPQCGGAFPPPVCDIPENPGEGNFREFEITRFLWDIIDTNSDDAPNAESITGGFPELWTVLTSSSGFNNSQAGFRSIGLLHEVQDKLAGREDWDPLRILPTHQHGIPAGSEPNGYRKDWAIPVTTSSTCAFGSGNELSISPSNSHSSKHLLMNNDFYHIKHPGGTLSITLKYQTQSGMEADLDVYLYNSSARVLGSSTVDSNITPNVIGHSTNEPDRTTGTIETESIVVDATAGDYLIQVQAYVDTIPGGLSKYELQMGGNTICPTTIP
ncbi:MAG: hypothetical protein KDD61_07050 [Bdellovibrionales bacterium]|nr:hypothetical protein [Bdellovibrionales bacterium]